ncbi:intercellular trafficking and secretion [Rhizophlyctis rosea]|uniref:Sorting nexin-4 n=1 Tax=Rhizophlyctis rosea TaxID=64517 RepID=A0AAD5X4I5_9FUNG|nr:intercellular trafficking and secretion [Rhizophlyctis rosea]
MEEVSIHDDAWDSGNPLASNNQTTYDYSPPEAFTPSPGHAPVHDNATLTTFAFQSNDVMRVSVTDPEKHGEGSSAFMTYLVITKTVIETYSAPEVSTRRRFQDFVWLHRTLSEEYPACIIPPLPGKHRMEYITGDRFSPDFIEKRRLSLQIYLERVARHPTLQRSATLKKFLEPTDLQHVEPQPKAKEGVFENISDAFINAFAKVKKQDDRFLEYKENLAKFEENLTAVEKLHTKLLRHETDLEQDLTDFENCMSTLASMETQITGPLNDFAQTIRETGSYLHDKEVLKQRDQKQVDYEELSSYLQNHMADRERTMVGTRAGGVASFIKDKYNELRQVDQEKARQAKLERLESKITELNEAVDQSKEVSEAFSNEVAKEIEFFQAVKVADFKTFLRDYADSQLEFHEKSLKAWDEVLPILEKISLEEKKDDDDLYDRRRTEVE